MENTEGKWITVFENIKGCLVEDQAGSSLFFVFSQAPEGRTTITGQSNQEEDSRSKKDFSSNGGGQLHVPR